MLESDLSWQAHHLVMLGCHFFAARATFGDVRAFLFVAGAAFGDVGVAQLLVKFG